MKRYPSPEQGVVFDVRATIADSSNVGPLTLIGMAARGKQGNRLHHLLHDINHDNRHHEIATGVNVGRESP